MFNAKVERLMLGEVEELWDAVAIAMYPSRQAMIEMMQSDAYQAIHQHREAGLAGQLNIETTDAVGLWLGASGFKMAEAGLKSCQAPGLEAAETVASFVRDDRARA